MFFNVLGTWLRGLLSIAVLVVGLILAKEWVEALPREIPVTDLDTGVTTVQPLTSFGDRIQAWSPGANGATALLAGAILLLLWTFAGRFVSPILWRKGNGKRPDQEPLVHTVRTDHGYDLHVEEYGSPENPPLVLVHGVGSDRTQWREAIEDLSDRFRIFAFDLLGHGKSAHDGSAEHTLEAAARDLDRVIDIAGLDRLVLAGHSMGGMIAMTWYATFPDRAARLAGLVLVHTTPQSPYETMDPVPLNRALKPAYGPILKVTAALSPLVRVMNWMSYWNGSAHWQNDLMMFGGDETREQLGRACQLQARMDPAAVARYCLAMMRFEMRPKLPDFDVHTVVVAAEKDGVTRPEASDFIAKRIPGAELVVLKNTRHMGFVERRNPFADAVRRFHAEGPRQTKAVAAAR